jgi:hypothetical protein
MHPDLANPPVYPLVLAGAMKAMPKVFKTQGKSSWGGRVTAWYKSDFVISLFNQALFLVLIIAVFFWARRLFDPAVAWLSAVLLLGSELFWRFTVSGLSTMLLMLIFMALVWFLTLIESEAAEPKWGAKGLLLPAALVGACVGIGALTRYSFGWLIVPVVAFLVLFGGTKRFTLALLVLVVFVGLMTPWLLRNYKISGMPFGTASFAILESTDLFPENRLERTLEPDFSTFHLGIIWKKFVLNSREIVHTELPRLGGTWLTAFFLVGLLLPFRKPALSRVRHFLLMCLLILAVVQAFGRTQLSADSPEINSENLLVLVAPLVLVYGVSLFFLLLDQLALPEREWRYAVIGAFSLVACLPLLLAFLPPRRPPIDYPFYTPQHVEVLANWLKEQELTMTDVPWEMAWYGQRQAVWVTLRAVPDPSDPSTHEDFFTINDYMKPISILFLTPRTTDARFLSQWARAGQGWGNFMLEVLVRKNVPNYFPLGHALGAWWPEELVLSDRARWQTQ